MYNEELKEKFLLRYTNVNRWKMGRYLFEALEKYENAWGADICTRSTEELQPVVSEISGMRESSIHSRLSILKDYFRWCLENGVPGATDGIFAVESIDLGKIKRMTVANPTHLQAYLDCIYEDESEGTMDCVYRCYFWLAYSGIAEDKIVNLTTSNVNFMNMSVDYENTSYPIYREGIQAFRNCAELKSFKINHPHYTTYKDRVEGDQLMRGVKKTTSIVTIRSIVSRRQGNRSSWRGKSKDSKDMNLMLSYPRLQLSGLYYRQYEYERAGGKVDFMDAALRFTEGKTYRLESGRNLIGAVHRRRAGQYQEDYIRWKEAHSI